MSTLREDMVSTSKYSLKTLRSVCNVDMGLRGNVADHVQMMWFGSHVSGLRCVMVSRIALDRMKDGVT